MAPTEFVFSANSTVICIATTQSHVTGKLVFVLCSGLVHVSECSPFAAFRTMVYETCLVPLVLVLARVSVVAPATWLGSDAYDWQIRFYFHSLVLDCLACLVHADIVGSIDFHHIMIFDCCIVICCVALRINTVINTYATY